MLVLVSCYSALSGEFSQNGGWLTGLTLPWISAYGCEKKKSYIVWLGYKVIIPCTRGGYCVRPWHHWKLCLGHSQRCFPGLCSSLPNLISFSPCLRVCHCSDLQMDYYTLFWSHSSQTKPCTKGAFHFLLRNLRNILVFVLHEVYLPFQMHLGADGECLQWQEKKKWTLFWSCLRLCINLRSIVQVIIMNKYKQIIF